MNSRDWVVDQLRQDSLTITPLGDHGLLVSRPGLPHAIVSCCELSTMKVVTADFASHMLHDLPQTQMIVFFSSQVVEPRVYDIARVHGLCIGTFGDLISALNECDDIGTYQHGEEQYIRRRINSTRAVTDILRKGHRAWQLERINRLRALTIVTSDEYEVTDREFTTALEQYPTLDLDAFVATSPNTQGFSYRVSASARDAGIKLLTMKEFVRTLRQPWT